MTTSKDIVSGQPKNPDELIANISKLMAEAEEMLSESTSQHAEESIALLRGRYEETASLLATHYANVKAKVSEAAKQTDATIRAYPYEALGLALGLGVLLGLGLSRRR